MIIITYYQEEDFDFPRLKRIVENGLAKSKTTVCFYHRRTDFV
jgi:hypothetical protein